MEAQIRKRKPVRANFTKTFNSLMEELSNESVQEETVRTRFSTLERLSSDLCSMDDDILNHLLEDETKPDEYEKEYTLIETYKEKMDRARINVETYFSKQSNVTAESVVSQELIAKRKLKLPKIELVKFGGDVKDWLSFWSQFKRIHEDCNMADEDKFQYLIQCMSIGSRARDIIDSFPPTADNYAKAIESLTDRFGRPELMTEFYVRELLALVIKNATDQKNRMSTAQLYDKLESYLRSLESIGMTSDRYSAMLFPLVESCVPEEILRVWLRNHSAAETVDCAGKSYNDKLKKLILFLRSEVESEERISLAKSGFKIYENNPRKEKKYMENYSIPSANDLFSADRKVAKQKMCIFCEKQHESKDCFLAPQMNYNQKQEVLKKKRSCFTCLKIGHQYKNCRSSVKCLICSEKHWPVMCPELEANKEKKDTKECKETDNENTISNLCSTEGVLLQTLLVNLEEAGKKRTVRALFDTGSQRSYILKRTAEEMGYKSTGSETLVHLLFGGATSRKENHQCYNVLLENMTGDFSCKIPVLSQPVICGSIGKLTLGPWMEEIKKRGIQLTDVGEGYPPIEILIGADVAGRLFTGNVCKLDCGLVAVQSLLGWTIMGRLQGHLNTNKSSTLLSTLLSHPGSIEDLWKLEAIDGITDPCQNQTKDDLQKAVLDHFEETVTFNAERRYEITLPLLDSRDDLPDNETVAEKRLLHSTNKLEAYDVVLQKWLDDGIIEEVLLQENWKARLSWNSEVPIDIQKRFLRWLCWIKREDRWGVFVKNRVKEIHSSTESQYWNHVPGRDAQQIFPPEVVCQLN